MTGRLDLINRTYNKGQKTYRFTLEEASQASLTLYHAPDGFIDDNAFSYNRNARYFSVLRKASENELYFVKEGRQFLVNVYENVGIDANITLTVEKLNDTTQEYESFPFANKVDLATYDVDEIGVYVQMMDSSFKEKIINRSTAEVDVQKRVSNNGTTMPAFSLPDFKIPDTSIDKEALFTENGAGFITILEHVVPILMGATDFGYTQTPATGAGDVAKKTGSFVNTSTEQIIVTIIVDIQGSFLGNATPNNLSVETYVLVIDNSETEVNRHGVGSKAESSVISMSFSYQNTIILTLEVGQSLNLQSIISHTTEKFSYDVADVSFEEIYIGTPALTVIAIPYYELFLGILQLTSDEQNPFKSDLFGRTDSAETTYGSDGAESLGVVTRGIYFRKAANLTNTIPISLEKAFDSMSSVIRLGMGYEIIGGVDKMVIERRDYFLKSVVVIDISDRLRSQDIRKKALPKDYFKDAEFGYGKFTYENNGGLYEFNTKSVWTTVIQSVFGGLKKVSGIRADGQGMRLLINAPFESGYDQTADYRGDDDLFMVDCIRDSGDLLARTNEGFSSISGSVYADSSFNVRLSPARNLRRWGSDLKAGLLKSLSSVLRWQASDKNSTLSSQLSTEGSPVVENADVPVSDLADTRYLLEELTAEAPITTAELNAIDAEPNGLIKLSDVNYGWINTMIPSTKDQMAKFKILRCNLAVVTPT